MLAFAVVMAAAATGVLNAADYMFAVNNKSWSEAAWVQIGDETGSLVKPPSGDNTFWIISAYKDPASGKTGQQGCYSNSTKMPGTLCLGSATDSPFGLKTAKLMAKSSVWTGSFTTIRWYNGVMRTAGYSHTWSGAIVVCDGGSGSAHTYNWHPSYYADFSGPISSDSEAVSVRVVRDGGSACTLAKLDSSSPRFCMKGDNSGYKGTFKMTDPYFPFVIAGDHALGDPSVPNAAALILPDNGAVRLDATAGKQCSTRGIRLDGATGYLVTLSAVTNTLSYPVTKAENAAGAFTKYGAGTCTYDGAYSAGEIVVLKGTLKIGPNASFPDGQVFTVKDGASLVFEYCPGLGRHTVTTEGSGTYSYPEGMRVTAGGKWEMRVKAAVLGDGSVSPTAESWVAPGSTVTLTAVDGSDAFVRWEGLSLPDVFVRTLVLRVDQPKSLTANFGLPAKPADFAEDGVIGTFADRVLTIAVDSGKTCTYDYSALVSDGYVTNIVKSGAGTLEPAVAPDYCGAFTLNEGKTLLTKAGQLGAEGCGTVVKASAASLELTAEKVIVCSKWLRLAGTVNSAITGSWDNGVLANCDIVLDGNCTWAESKNHLEFCKNSHVDTCGHTLTLQAKDWCWTDLTGVVFTNSSTTASTVQTSWNRQLRLSRGTAFWGGAKNKVYASYGTGSDNAMIFASYIAGDWTLAPSGTGGVRCSAASTANSFDYGWAGSLSIDSGIFNIDTKDGCLTFGGPVEGENALTIKGGIVNYRGAENTFAGSITVGNETSNKLRSKICVWDGAAFSCGSKKVVALNDADFWIDGNTAFALPAYVHAAGSCTFSGGPSAAKPCGRATVASFTKTGGTTLTFDSPAIVTGTTAINTGTLALGTAKESAAELPVFSNLVFAADTTFDMNGNDLSVPNLTGIPTITNPGKLTITGNWTIDYAELADGAVLDLGAGSLEFASGATVTVVNRGSSIHGQTVLARAQGGVTGVPPVIGWNRKLEVVNGELRTVLMGLLIVVE